MSNLLIFINIYYSCFLIVLSIIDIVVEDVDLSVLSLILTILLTISLFFIDSQQFSERANTLKKNYISMQKILFSLSEENLSEMKGAYLELLNESENHSNSDYYKALIESSDDLKMKTFAIIKYLLLYYVWVVLCKAFFVILPFAISLWVF